MEIKTELNKIITQRYTKHLSFAKSLAFKNRARSYSPLHEDVLHECYADLLEMDEKRLKLIIPFFDKYIYQMLKYSIISSTSKYQRKYEMIDYHFLPNLGYFPEVLDEEVDDKHITYTVNDKQTGKMKTYQFTMEDIHKEINNCGFYDAEIFKRKTKEYSTFREFSEDTGIPISSLFMSFNRVRNKIKTNIKK